MFCSLYVLYVGTDDSRMDNSGNIVHIYVLRTATCDRGGADQQTIP